MICSLDSSWLAALSVLALLTLDYQLIVDCCLLVNATFPDLRLCFQALAAYEAHLASILVDPDFEAYSALNLVLYSN